MYKVSNQKTALKTIVLYPFSLLLSSLFLLVALTGCVPISYYDSTTYSHLTSLKAETTILVESFDTKTISENEEKIEKVTLNLQKAYEYDKGKGKDNSDTTKQFKLIIEMFNEDVSDYKKGEKLGDKYYTEAAKALGDAFDIAIATENLKNKDKH